MSDTQHATILRQMTGRKTDDVAEVPQTASRALRQTLAKSAQETIGLGLTVMGVADERHALDAYLGDLDPELMIFRLQRRGELVGLIALDMQLRAAMLEVQTLGKLIAADAEPRPPTRTDEAMCLPVISAFLAALPAATIGTNFAEWLTDLSLGERFADAKAAGLVLADGTYRAVQLGIDLGVADRQGQLVMALPAIDVPITQPAAKIETPDWAPTFQAVVEEATGQLDAVLHRFRLPLGRAQALKIGDVLPLHGGTVSSVRLKGPDGQLVAQAKLGQSGGMRAVRIETAPTAQLADLSTAPHAAITASGLSSQNNDKVSSTDSIDAAADAQMP